MYLFARCCRLREYRATLDSGQSGDDGLRFRGHPFDIDLPVERRRTTVQMRSGRLHAGSLLLPLLELRLLLLRREADAGERMCCIFHSHDTPPDGKANQAASQIIKILLLLLLFFFLFFSFQMPLLFEQADVMHHDTLTYNILYISNFFLFLQSLFFFYAHLQLAYNIKGWSIIAEN